MTATPAVVRAIIDRVRARPDVLGARDRHQFRAVMSALSAVGWPWTW